jgi:hypothetical protein
MAELSDEREALEDLLRSEGWRIFLERVYQEWQGPGYFARMGTALKAADPLEAKVVHKTSLEVTGMLQWPKARLAELSKKAP